MPIENFDNVPDALRKPADPENPAEEERMHIPVVTVSRQSNMISHNDCIDIQIKGGEIEHEMTSEHFIDFIDIYVDSTYVMRAALTAKRTHPFITICLNEASGGLAVISHCNIHGGWIAKTTLDET